MVERFHDDAHGTFFQAPLPPGPRAAGAPAEPSLSGAPTSTTASCPPAARRRRCSSSSSAPSPATSPLRELGLRSLRAVAPRVRQEPFSSGFFLVAVDHATGDAREVVIAGDPQDPRTRALTAELAATTDARVLPGILPAAGAPESILRAYPAFAGKVALQGQPTAFVCRLGACEAPTGDPRVLRQKLSGGG